MCDGSGVVVFGFSWNTQACGKAGASRCVINLWGGVCLGVGYGWNTQSRTHTHHLVVEGVEHDHSLRGVRHEAHELHNEEDEHEDPVARC